MIQYEYHPAAKALYEQDHWSEHHIHTRQDWYYDVVSDNTNLGYWEWLTRMLFDDDEDLIAPNPDTLPTEQPTHK